MLHVSQEILIIEIAWLRVDQVLGDGLAFVEDFFGLGGFAELLREDAQVQMMSGQIHLETRRFRMYLDKMLMKIDGSAVR